MFGSTVLDVGIGIVLVYLLLSIVVTSAKEGVATLLHNRGKFLSEGIEKLLNGQSPDAGNWLLRALTGPGWSGNTGLAAMFFRHPLILPLWTDGQKPSYIPAETFSKVLLDLLRRGEDAPLAPVPGAPPASAAVDMSSALKQIHAGLNRHESAGIRSSLVALLHAARFNPTGDAAELAKLEKQIETWFDHTMDQVSSSYKRHTQLICFLIAAVFTVTLDIDTIRICRQLSREATLRVALTEAAKSHLTQGLPKVPTPGEMDINKSLAEVANRAADLQNLGIPLGWSPRAWSIAWPPYANAGLIVSKLLGLMMTALAATLGAPFWFDMLNRFMSIRGVGKAPNEESKSPKKEEPPQ
jgi:hypothetical protein